MLYRYVRLSLDEDLADGWAVNDAGEKMYFNDGKAQTGWQTIKGKKYYFTREGVMISGKRYEIDGKWYYFYPDGSLAVNTRINGYQVDENGVRQPKY